MLPIHAFRGDILASVEANPVTIIVAETGAGKSTQVPQFLAETGARVAVTQPRRLAVRALAARVAEEMGAEMGGHVGYLVGGGESRVSSQTRITFLTDGLQLVRELIGGKRAEVLIVDEVHEWNEHLEVLVAWARMQLREGAGFKLILMSATLEADRLASWFDGAPIIRVPGRLFPIQERPKGAGAIEDTVALLQEGRNVLLFQPGKGEIDTACARLAIKGVDAEIIPLHGGLSPQEQRRAFMHFGRPKCIVATNVAQTSITIDDIDAVVDTGVERRIEIERGVEGLMIRAISLADRDQRKGRAGRTRPGIYIDHCPVGVTGRRAFPVAEIQRVRLDRAMLRLAEAGVDLRQMELFHAPDGAALNRAAASLEVLGLMGPEGITRMGRRVARLPVTPSCGRMLIEGAARGVLPQLLTAAAIIEAGGIVRPPSRNEAERPDWRKGITCQDSDVLAQVELYERAQRMSRQERETSGISFRGLEAAREIRRALERAVEGKLANAKCGGDPGVEARKALAAGLLDSLWESNGAGRYRSPDDSEAREIGNRSVVRGGEWIVGIPFNVEFDDKRGRRRTHHVLESVTAVDPLWLSEIAPHLAEVEVGADPQFDGALDSCTALEKTLFRGRRVGERRVPTPEHPEAIRALAECLSRMINDAWFRGAFPVPPELAAVIEHNRAVATLDRVYFDRTGQHLSFWDGSRHNIDAFKAWIAERLEAQGARCMAQIRDAEALRFPLSQEEQAAQAVIARRPAKVTVLGREREVNWQAGKANLILALTTEEIDQLRGDVLVDGVPLQCRDWVGWHKTIKERWEERLDRARMDAAGKLDLPEIPDPICEEDVVILTFAFPCPLTGETLEMTGVAQWEPPSWTSNGEWLSRWSLDDPEEILEVAEQSRAHLREVARERAAQQERREREERERQQRREQERFVQEQGN